MMFNNVLVFGPTGEVGRAVAKEAKKRGATVWLAMRDVAKDIPGIDHQDEAMGQFKRIQADLTDSTSVRKAVEISAARAAFVYRVHTQDGMRETLTAMKSAGIHYVVFLSSFSIRQQQDLRQIPVQDFIAFVHAQVEITLEDLGIDHTALRPGMFASKPFKQDLDASEDVWEASLPFEDIVEDSISPVDVGRVGGAVLVDRPSPLSKEAIYLCGPQLHTLRDLWKSVSEITGREIRVTHPSLQTKLEQLAAKGFPPPLAADLVRGMEFRQNETLYPVPFHTNAVENIRKYSGYEPTSFRDYVIVQDFN